MVHVPNTRLYPIDIEVGSGETIVVKLCTKNWRCRNLGGSNQIAPFLIIEFIIHSLYGFDVILMKTDCLLP